MNHADIRNTQLTTHILDLLLAEDRPMQNGEIAVRLQMPTYRVVNALDEAMHRSQVCFIEAHGWVLTDTLTPAFPEPDGQQFLQA